MASQRKTNGSEPHQRILLLEGDPHEADVVTQALHGNAHASDEVLRVDTAPAFAEALESFEPDVVVSGSVAGLNSREALHMSRQRHPEVPFLLVTETLDRSVVESLRAGAADFVTTQELEKLPAAVDTALAQRAPLRRLSRRQREVFRLLASGVTMRDIASRLGLSRKTVETHRAQVMARLGARHVPELVRLAIQLWGSSRLRSDSPLDDRLRTSDFRAVVSLSLKAEVFHLP
jgi:DNA-binding NarL/FixJ family response regulator